MFDVSFSELLVIAVVALLVVGPERLPKVARTAGHLLGRLQRYVSDVKADINREMQLDELKRLQQQVQDAARDMELSVNKEFAAVEESVKDTWTITDEQPAVSASPPTALETPAAEKEAGAADPAALRPAGEPIADAAAPQLELDLDRQAPARRAS